jgi:DNA-binding response OmpR family regulator
LLARIKALLRRAAPETSADSYRFGDVEVDFRKAEVRRNGLPITLTAHEFKLLSTFIQRRGRILNREKLLLQVWGTESNTTHRVIDNHVMNLRRKIEPNPKKPIYLVTKGGLGYRFDG